MSNHILNGLASRFQILTRIKMIRMLCEVLTDVTCHSKTDIGIDINLTYCKFSCLTKLFLRNTHCIRHISAILVNHLNELLRNGRRTVQNDRETRQTLNALLQYVETERRRNKAAVSLNLYWGQAALALLTCLCAIVSLREKTGF